MVGALVTVPVGLGTVTGASAASSVTVTGPKVWQPAPVSAYGPNGSVTVSQTDNLTDQVVQVSWSGFTPSVSRVDGHFPTAVNQRNDEVLYPVRIYQCRGADPKVTDCYGSTLFNADPAKEFEQPTPREGTTTPDFPSNMRIAVTGADGSGAAAIELWSKKLSPSLGCDAQHACSIVVEANYGGDPLDFYQLRGGQPDCADHSVDNDGFFMFTASDAIVDGTYDNPTTGNRGGELCAWNNRTVIPIHFAATPDECRAAQNPDIVAAGLEMANRAMQQWITGLCLEKSPLAVQYTSAGGEPQARRSFLSGTRVNLGLTALPDRDTPTRPYVYAPITNTGISVVYWVDDPKTGRQFRDLRLNPRLLAKMLTQTYASPGIVLPTVAGNPVCLFDDGEFRKLNPLPAASGQSWPECSGTAPSLPIVLGTSTDMTSLLTTWIASDPDAARFLEGERDPWGTRINTRYLRPGFTGFPVDQLIRQDDSGIVVKPGEPHNSEDVEHWKQYEWNPLQTSLSDLIRWVQQGQPTGRQPTIEADGTHKKIPAQAIGQRTIFAILDSAQAKAYSLPEAALLNAAGAYVSPTANAFQAAVADMPVDPATGTQLLPYGQADSGYGRDQRAYPLTVVQYAMAPTGGLGDRTAAVTRFLKTVTDTGQLYGVEPGRLPEGFLALTKDQRAQAQEAIRHVEAQDGRWPGNQKPPAEPGGGEHEPEPGAGGSGGSGSGGTPAEGTGGSTGGGTGGAGTTGGTGGTGSTGGTGTTGGTATGTDGGTGGTGGSSGSGSGGLGSTGTTGGGAAPAAGAPAAQPAAEPAAAAGTGAGATPGRGTGPAAAAPKAAGSPAPDRSGGARLLLPIALIAGLVLLVGGPAALLLGGTAAGARVIGATRTVWARIRRRP
ncbi:hypothetical protein ACFP3U_31035 [Kitasatospora misakiensis]|uniref:PBP domain-containing protein n=1 Tax=Kitasatospora misakiensis TaxID=67330 RepID=A0ABW0XH02_9ACTN